jgi:dihydrodipicolinate synthase/N-acetylneuraminate lyase
MTSDSQASWCWSKPMQIHGPVFAIVTPFDARGEVDCGALDAYLRFLAHHGVRNIVANGTTGEFASLTAAERCLVLERCRSAFPGTIINHVSCCSYKDCHTLLDHSRDHADGILLLPPYYYAGIDDAGCLAFFRRVLERNALPAYLYNFPEHTQAKVSPEMLRHLADAFPVVAGIKDSGGDLGISMSYKKAVPGLQVFVGGDRCALEVLRLGLDGSVTGCGSPVPEFLVAMHHQVVSGDHEAARLTQRAFDRWTDFRESLPINHLPVTKAGLTARIPGFPPHVRPPFLTADDATIARIRSALEEMGLD